MYSLSVKFVFYRVADKRERERERERETKKERVKERKRKSIVGGSLSSSPRHMSHTSGLTGSRRFVKISRKTRARH